ncbi:MAG: hypothetical protein RIM84_05240 [Alphaproteobacteria bacterium]
MPAAGRHLEGGQQLSRGGLAAVLLRALLVCLTLAAPAAAAAATDQQREPAFQAGVAAFDAGDYAAAREAWLPLARDGDPAAQRNLAHLYRRGLGVAQDFAEAATWYERAAELGLASAQVNLALMYVRGQGVEQRYDRAAEWLDLAARQGHVLGQYNLGLLYWRGLGVEQSPPHALGWLYLAARGGHKGAMAKLGQFVQELPGPAAKAAQRRAAATTIATVSPAKSEPVAPQEQPAPAPVGDDADTSSAGADPIGALARLLFAGDSDPDEDEIADPLPSNLSRKERLEIGRAAYLNGNYSHALAAWRKLARAGDGEAQYLMGGLYGEPRFSGVNVAESYRWYHLAAANGHGGAADALAQLERQISADEREAAMALVRGE